MSAGKVDGLNSLGRDRIGRRTAVEDVRPCPRATVNLDTRWGCRRQIVKGTILRLDRLTDLAMHRTDGRKLDKRAPHCLDHGLDCGSLATDDRFLGGVANQYVNAALLADRCSHGFCRARDDAGDPVNRLFLRDFPEPASRVT